MFWSLSKYFSTKPLNSPGLCHFTKNTASRWYSSSDGGGLWEIQRRWNSQPGGWSSQNSEKRKSFTFQHYSWRKNGTSRIKSIYCAIKILPTDKGKATAILNTADYESKMKILLSDSAMYKVLKKDPTPKYKDKMLNILRTWKRGNHLRHLVWEDLFHIEEVSKFHKKGALPLADRIWLGTSHTQQPST